jgi:hypothetical protein
MFQTPVALKLSESEGKILFDAFAALLEEYDAGRIPQDRIEQIKRRNNFENKIAAIRQSNKKNN